MPRFLRNELDLITAYMQQDIPRFPDGTPESVIRKSIVVKIEEYKRFDCGYKIPEAKLQEINEVISTADQAISSYGTLNDLSLVGEYEKIKKVLVMVQNYLSEIYAELETGEKFAGERLKEFLGIITRELRDKGENKTNAENIAKADERIYRAMADYEEYSLVYRKVRRKWEVIERILSSVIQSISVARPNIIREGGQHNS